jgi:hypothetical protein
MMSKKPNSLANRIAGKALSTQLKSGRFLDLPLGVALLRDGRIPASTKAMTMAFSLALMTGLVALEIPIEGFITMALPLLGFALDLAADGAEETIGTLLLTALLLPHIAPRAVVDAIRQERSGSTSD